MGNEPDGADHDKLPVLLSRGEFATALHTANDVVSLKSLYNRLGAIEELAKKMRLALSEENRIDEGRSQVARKLGQLRRTSVRRGGVSSNAHGESSIRRGSSSGPLPAGIDKNMSSRLQALGSIPKDGVT